MASHTEQLLAVIESQKAKGLSKYGALLEDGNHTDTELIDHALEELVDLCFYLIALKEKLED